jgi:hypothetical protein
MDLQTLDRNYFWYERPRVIVQELKDYFDEVEDVTGLSDGAPSILVNKKYYVFLPTGIVDHNELEYNKYTVMREEDYGFGNEYHRFTFMDEVIEYLQQMLKEDETISKREILHRMSMIKDDLAVIRMQMTGEQLHSRTYYADDLLTHFNNITIACDLDTNESLDWKLYSNGRKND